MSTFDSSTQKVGNGLNVDTTITLMDSLACHAEAATYGGVGSNPTTTYGPSVTKTVTVASDEVALVIVNFNFGISDGSSSTGRAAIYVNGVQYGADYVIESAQTDAGASGIKNSASFSHFITGYSGSVTYGLYYSRNTGAGTIYIGNSEINVLLFKYRPS